MAGHHECGLGDYLFENGIEIASKLVDIIGRVIPDVFQTLFGNVEPFSNHEVDSLLFYSSHSRTKDELMRIFMRFIINSREA